MAIRFRPSRLNEMCDILRGIPGILWKHLESPRDREIKDNYETLLVTRLFLLQSMGYFDADGFATSSTNSFMYRSKEKFM